MAVERASGATSLIDVLDRVLDKGIVIDARARAALERSTRVRVPLVGIDLMTAAARVVVASIETDLQDPDAVGPIAPVSRRPSVPDERLAAHASRPAPLAEPARQAVGAQQAQNTDTGARATAAPRTNRATSRVGRS